MNVRELIYNLQITRVCNKTFVSISLCSMAGQFGVVTLKSLFKRVFWFVTQRVGFDRAIRLLNSKNFLKNFWLKTFEFKALNRETIRLFEKLEKEWIGWVVGNPRFTRIPARREWKYKQRYATVSKYSYPLILLLNRFFLFKSVTVFRLQRRWRLFGEEGNLSCWNIFRGISGMRELWMIKAFPCVSYKSWLSLKSP